MTVIKAADEFTTITGVKFSKLIARRLKIPRSHNVVTLVIFKFPKVVQAHILGEVGNLGTVLLRVYSGTMLPIFY